MEAADVEHHVSRASGIPRLSRLPRAPGAMLESDSTGRSSHIPRPTTIQPKTTPPVLTSSQHANTAHGSRFGWNSKANGHPQVSLQHGLAATGSNEAQRSSSARSECQVDHRLLVDDAETLAMASVQDGTSGTVSEGTKRKKPRPSLSERTIETMSHIPPSPSPSRRKSSISNVMGSMLPPAKPASPTGRSSPQARGLKSPSLRTPGKITGPLPVLHPSQASSRVYSTPLRNNSQGERIPSSASAASISKADPNLFPVSTPKTLPAAHRVKSLRDLRTSTNKQPVRKASLNFRDIGIASTNVSDTTLTTKPGSLTARPRPLNTSTPSKLKKRPSILDKQVPPAESATGINTSSKSSATLRETIAKAKAAKKQNDAPNANSNADLHELSSDQGISSQSLKRRVQNAVTSGVLNIAALGLTEFPKEVMQMYDFSEGSNRNWSEAVDMTKLILADNDLAQIPDAVFPDWSIEEMQDDEDKTNILGGLEVLDLRGNTFAQLPIGIRRLERLHTLNLSNNKLECHAIEILSQLPNLQNLSLSNNNLSGALPSCVGQLTQLHTLDLHDNKLTSVDLSFSSMVALRKLNFAGNLLESLPVHELENIRLVDLNASRNRISSFTPSTDGALLMTLQDLNLSSNELKSLWKDGASSSELQSLIIDSNQLATLPNLNSCPNLITLTASHNRFEDLPDGFVGLQALRTVNLSSNDIRLLDPYISRMESLAVFNVSSNPLRDRKFLTMTTADLKEELAKRLTAVFVKDGSDTTTNDGEADGTPATGLIKVEKGNLDLSAREFSTVNPDDIDLVSSVNSVDLSKNRLQTFPLELLKHNRVRDNLKSLVLSHNTTFDPISYITLPTTFANLRSLSLASTGIVSIDALSTYLSAPMLTDLNLCCNRLRGPLPTFKKTFPALTTLLISDNELTSITPNAISGLEVVDVRNNDIEFLPPKIGELGNTGDEKKTGRLRTLECTGNKFRVPRLAVLERGTEAILRDLRRMVITDELGEEWRE